jgi:hypothetical protein
MWCGGVELSAIKTAWSNASGAKTIGRLASGLRFSEFGVFDAGGHPELPKNVSGT